MEKISLLKNSRRILLIGCSGSGKSSLARILGSKLNLEVIHLDRLFWKPGWEARKRDEFYEIVSDQIKKEKWIMDGNYSRTLRLRAERSDFIILFDFPSYICTYRIFKRSFKGKLNLEKRYDIADGCSEKWFDMEFVKFTWNFKKRTTPFVYNTLNDIGFDKNRIVIFKKLSQYSKFLTNINKEL